MKKACEQYREQIEKYRCGLLEDRQEIAWLIEHAQDCPECGAMMKSFDRQEEQLNRWVESLDPVLRAGQEKVVAALRESAVLKETEKQFAGKGIFTDRLFRNCAAAILLIVAGFVAGKLFAPKPDLAALEARLVQSMQPAVEDHVADRLRGDIEQGMGRLHDRLSAQVSEELNSYAEQTLAASTYQTQRLLTDLIEAVNTAQAKDRLWMVSAVNQIEHNRLQDKQQIGNHLVHFATLTENELVRTKEEMAGLILANLDHAQGASEK